ncbi:Translation elongation factor Ts [Dissulfuribacter thermophilus]|uniref:Elongation factor Ts n=1 Tax=Dissulfuribacter thermophilus TaxID=1156395 RepID=A0A1B9F8B1_9BACT|nr:translation elongation factor Ts [Dissulfuribacter thermophilus]OCC16045.1 Translation elongation factor Ts [Dissulfuribacter thermophilus]
MATITADMVKELRTRTNAGMMDCKKALQECGGDMDKAVQWLRQKGLAVAAKRAGRATSEGVIQSYIHAGNKLGVLVEVNCETDFVAKTDQFVQFAKDVAMHIAAANPICIKREEVPEDVLNKERELYEKQAKEQGKPDHIIEKIVTGRLEKFYKEVCLLEQPFVKDPDKSIQDLLNELIASIGENISIRRFARFQVGQED